MKVGLPWPLPRPPRSRLERPRSFLDSMIYSRITNDERPLRRIVKKLHTYSSCAHPTEPPLPGADHSDAMVEGAREAFLLELSSFQLSLQKSLMVCEAEARQVEEYQKERERIEAEQVALRNQIEELKVALELAHQERRRKVEYDQIAERVNTLPSRDELEGAIQALENDMAAIHAEHETQDRIIRSQKAALDTVVLDLTSLRILGKDKDAPLSQANSPAPTPAPDMLDTDDGLSKGPGSIEAGELEDGNSVDTSLSRLNPNAREFNLSQRGSSSALGDDIEMGELAEDSVPAKGKKKRHEELEEGEASDSNSSLSDPPGE
ncbi:hypothetical protein CONPUDRAFT_164950 [Coniophora puteana RWD-64-598 SS2]|uniref:Uncharacterized protein n=1 Tax=Coniophora puteana (strain RWD-64-598) TaxID=741705 RepID=A0A5M3MT37_CONPW|nr:uncharacterized protein CONPUDRAFT_164950 [Coniophora puteana RWD-64-598 SS2]EIW82332.1 hypothetical protein CONPUDRAFT_164950 [Coniophora puteana RWD-64-598 SS2]